MLRISLLKLRIALLIAVVFTFLTANRVVYGNVSNISKHIDLRLASPPPVVYTTLMTGQARDAFQEVNREREERGLKPLLWHDKLAKLALKYSEQMADENFFSHFDGDGKSVKDRAEEAEITDWLKLGENLFTCKGFDDPVDVAIRGWLKSKTHRINMFDPDWTHTGVGVFETKNGRTYITQVFISK